MKTRTSTPKATADTIDRLSGEVEAVRSIAGGYDNPSTRRPIYVESVAALKAQSVASLPNGAVFVTKGYYSSGDGGAGEYVYNSASSATDNGGTVIAPTAGSGRYLLQVEDVVNVRQFGAKGDATTNDAAAIQAAIDYLTNGGEVFFPPSSGFLVGSTININRPNITLRGTRLGFRSAGAATVGTPDIIYNGAGAAIQINAVGSSSTESVVIDGLWLFGGTAGNYSSYVGDTGILCGNTSGTFKSAVGHIQNCAITNFATYGMREVAASSLFVVGCNFTRNGTGVFRDNLAQAASRNGLAVYRDCRFTFHREMAFRDDCQNLTTIVNCVFELNDKQAIGGTSPYLGSVISIVDCDFEVNCQTLTGQYWIDLSAGTWRGIVFSLNRLHMPNGTNSAIRIVGTGSGSSEALFSANTYTGQTGGKKGIIGSNGSNPIWVTMLVENTTDWTFAAGSTVAALNGRNNSAFSGITGAASISGSIQAASASSYFYFENYSALMLAGGVQYRLNGSRTGAQGNAAAAGSLCNNSAPVAGKHQLWACVTGGASPTYRSLNASVCGWVLLNSDTPDVTDFGQIKVGGPRTVTNFLNGQDGQTILVLASGGTITFTASATIVTKSGSDISLANNQMVRFTLNGSAWTEC